MFANSKGVFLLIQGGDGTASRGESERKEAIMTFDDRVEVEDNTLDEWWEEVSTPIFEAH